jgi:hypothetical protein
MFYMSFRVQGESSVVHFRFFKSHFHQEGNFMPKNAAQLAILVEQFKQGEQIPFRPLDLEKFKKRCLPQFLAEVEPAFHREISAKSDVRRGKGWLFFDWNPECRPAWFIFEKAVFQEKRYYCRQLTWKQSDDFAKALDFYFSGPGLELKLVLLDGDFADEDEEESHAKG